MLPSLARNGSEEVFQLMLYNRNASILPSYVILRDYGTSLLLSAPLGQHADTLAVDFSNFSTISERKIEWVWVVVATWLTVQTPPDRPCNGLLGSPGHVKK